MDKYLKIIINCLTVACIIFVKYTVAMSDFIIDPVEKRLSFRRIKLFAMFVLLSRFQEIKSSVSLPPYAYPEKK